MRTALLVKGWAVKLFELKVLAWLEQGCWVVMDVFILERRQLPAGRRCSIRKHEVRQKPEPAPSFSIQIQHSRWWYEYWVGIWKLEATETDHGWVENQGDQKTITAAVRGFTMDSLTQVMKLLLKCWESYQIWMLSDVIN